MAIQLIITPINRLSGFSATLGLAFFTFVFACFALLPTLQAVNPAPDGGYPGGNTAEGQNTLFSLSVVVQYCSWVLFAQEQHHRQPQHGPWCWNTPVQHRRGKYSDWRGSAFKQHHRQLQYGQRFANASEQHHRQHQHGHWCVRTVAQHHRQLQHG